MSAEALSTQLIEDDDPGAISPAEAEFERWRRRIGLFAGPVALLLVLALPLPSLSDPAHRLAGIVSLVVIWWVSEAIPIAATALVGTALTVIFGIANAQDALAPFASPTIFLFMGSFMIGQAISAHQLDRRLALSLVSLHAVRGNPSRIRVALAGLTLLISGWMSNTATAAMMLPVALGVLGTARASGWHVGRRYSAGFLLAIAYAASIGGIMTPVGSPPNLITLGQLERLAGIEIPFFTWMVLMVPIAAVLGTIMLALAHWKFPSERESVAPAHSPQAVAGAPGPWTRGQQNCALAFAVAVVLWITPGVLAILGLSNLEWGRSVTARLDEGVVAIVAAGLLFVLPIDWRSNRFTLTWKEASRIEWGTILLCGAGLSLGRLMFVTGLAEQIGRTLVAISGADTLWSITAISVAASILLSEIASNTAATNMLVPVVIGICQVAQISPLVPALGACLGASMGFMLPISTPPNAIVYGTGAIPLGAMMRLGVMVDVSGFVTILIGLRVLCPILGLV
jgi:sodium-dependent dicarboxylate transporter 2/3/5